MRIAVEDFSEPSSPFVEDSLDLNAYPAVLRGLRKCNRCQTDLAHKLSIIMRAQGGWGNQGVWRTANKLKVSRHTVRRWFQWEAVPRATWVWERIDEQYDSALETLAKDSCRRRKKH